MTSRRWFRKFTVSFRQSEKSWRVQCIIIILQIFSLNAQLSKLGNIIRIFASFSRGIFSQVTRYEQKYFKKECDVVYQFRSGLFFYNCSNVYTLQSPVRCMRDVYRGLFVCDLFLEVCLFFVFPVSWESFSIACVQALQSRIPLDHFTLRQFLLGLF